MSKNSRLRRERVQQQGVELRAGKTEISTSIYKNEGMRLFQDGVAAGKKEMLGRFQSLFLPLNKSEQQLTQVITFIMTIYTYCDLSQARHIFESEGVVNQLVSAHTAFARNSRKAEIPLDKKLAPKINSIVKGLNAFIADSGNDNGELLREALARYIYAN